MTPSPDPRFEEVFNILLDIENAIKKHGFKKQEGFITSMVGCALAEAEKPLKSFMGIEREMWIKHANDKANHELPLRVVCRQIAAILEPKMEEKA